MRIYLDHAATTPLLPGVAEAMQPWLGPKFGNPSSLYAEGRQARSGIDSARETLSEAIGCEFGEVIFTSSGTEAANLAIVGAALGNEDFKRNRVLFGAAEHHCVLNTRPTLERLGFKVEIIPVGRDARPDIQQLRDTMSSDVLLISLMAANNEIGTIIDTDEIAGVAEHYGALYFCDAVQLPLSHLNPKKPATSSPSVQEPSDHPRAGTSLQSGIQRIPLMSLASHKLNGPKGAAVLVVRAGTKLKPLIAGGGQEREMRAGTEDVAAIIGFSEAVRIHRRKDDIFESDRVEAKKAFVEALDSLRITGLTFTASPLDDNVLSGHLHIRIMGVPAETILILLDRLGVCASSGAACSSGSIEPSHVLLACGFGEHASREGLRFSFGVGNDPNEARKAAELLAKAALGARGE